MTLAQAGSPTPPVAPDTLLHIGATVRVEVPRLADGWLAGTVVRSNTSGCLAVRLERVTRAGQPLYAFFRAIERLEVDKRTNQGVFTFGLPPAAADDWRPLTEAELKRLRRACRR